MSDKPHFHLYIHIPGMQPGLYASNESQEYLEKIVRDNPDFTPTKLGPVTWWIVQFNPGETVASSEHTE